MMKFEVIGNVGADAEVKEHNGSKFVTFRVANTDKWTGQDGVEHVNTDWVDCVLNNAQSKVIPYLKRGVKVFVRGNGSLRLYSSPKLRKMVAGAQINVLEIELCGGSTDEVPRELIEPQSGALIAVSKWYNADIDTSKFKKDDVGELIDRQGRRYLFNKAKWVMPAPEEQQQAQIAAESEQQQ